MTICESAFSVYLEKFPRMTDYTAAVTPHLSDAPAGIPLFIDSTVVLMMAWHEEFLKSIVANGILRKQNEARAYFAANGDPDERGRASGCSLAELLQMGRRRVTFKKRGAAAERVFFYLFGFSLWPSDQVRDQIVDLNVLRQLVVHHGGTVLGDSYWDQLTDKSLVETTQYDSLPPILRIDYHRCLTGFLKDAFLALAGQAFFVRGEMLKRPEWRYVPHGDASCTR